MAVARHVADAFLARLGDVAAAQFAAVHHDRAAAWREQAGDGVADLALAGAREPGEPDAFAARRRAG